MKILSRLFFLTACLALAACSEKPLNSTVIGTPYQAISVATPGVTGAHCFLQAGSMSYAVKTPAAVQVRRTPDSLSVTCFKGEHYVGYQAVLPIVAPAEAATLKHGEACRTCAYPSSISVMMLLDQRSMDKKLTVLP